MDKKGFIMGVVLPVHCKVIWKSGQRWPLLIQDRIQESVTVIETVSRDQHVLYPIIINKEVADYIDWYAGLTKDGLATFASGVSEKGWSNEKLGLSWLKDCFDSETKERYAPPFTNTPACYTQSILTLK